MLFNFQYSNFCEYLHLLKNIRCQSEWIAFEVRANNNCLVFPAIGGDVWQDIVEIFLVDMIFLIQIW